MTTTDDAPRSPALTADTTPGRTPAGELPDLSHPQTVLTTLRGSLRA